jgi:abortive infection bacteriophage resistance protein
LGLGPYAKTHLPIAGQIALVKERGLVITDEVKATDCLHRIGYYRLSGYWHPMREVERPAPQGPPTYLDQFKPGSNFSDVVHLYVFDKKLRMLMLDAIERVEVGLRVEIALLLSARSPWAHRDPRHVHRLFNGHAEWIERLDRATRRSSEDYVLHFRTRYTDPLPMWSAIELWDFGALSHFLSGMKDGDLATLGGRYGLPRRDLLKTWVRTINYVRNLCAHHNRLWNRVLVDIPSPPRTGELEGLDHLAASPHSQVRLYAAAVALRWFLKTINPTTTWPARLKAHLVEFPQSPHYNFAQTGFPEDWENLPFWN